MAALMMRHGNTAIDALHRSAAAAAKNGPGIPAAINQDQRLGAVAQAFFDSRMQRRGDRASLVRLLKFFAKADDFHGRKRPRCNSGRDCEELVLSFPGVVISF